MNKESLVEKYRKLYNKQNKFLCEKFSLQEYEGQIRDIIFEDVAELNKISALVCMFLLKHHLFILSRNIVYKDLKSSITLMFYNEEDGKDSVIKASKKNDLNLQYGPDEVEGMASGENISLYVPIKVGERAPYISGTLNREFVDSIKSERRILNGLKIDDCFIRVRDFESINEIVKSLKSKYNDKIVEVEEGGRKDLGINKAYILQTLKHELTHVLDNKNNTKEINHFGSGSIDPYLDYDEIDKDALSVAVNILYMLWSRTEFNAFTQTFSDSNSNKRDLIRKDRLERISSKYLSRPLRSGRYENIDYTLNELKEDLNWLESEFGNDNILWEAIRDICIDGSYESSIKERFEKMNWERFKNYFIHTTNKLMKKFRDKVVKNTAAQVDYNRDITNLASDIRDSVENSDIDNNGVVSFEFNYTQFFRKLNEPHKVYVEVEAVSSDGNDTAIAANSMIYITIADLNVTLDRSARELFGSEYDSFVNLIKEIAGKNRKSYINKFCLAFAEDLYNVLNKLEK